MTSPAASSFLRAGEVGNVGRDLARQHRIIGQAADLRELDLGVPVGALDQPAHQLAAVRPRRLDHPVAQRRRALLIGLDGDPEAAPAVGEQLVVGEQRLEHVHLQLEPVGFLGIDGEMDVGLAMPSAPARERPGRPRQALRRGA